jgi:hypothetical protein
MMSFRMRTGMIRRQMPDEGRKQPKETRDPDEVLRRMLSTPPKPHKDDDPEHDPKRRKDRRQSGNR